MALELPNQRRRMAPLPAVLTRGEIARVLAGLHGTPARVAGLLYGTGLRLLEGLRRRAKDPDFPAPPAQHPSARRAALVRFRNSGWSLPVNI